MVKMSTILQKALSLILVTAILSSLLSLGVFAATDEYRGPSIKSVSMNLTRSQITLIFDKEIEAAVSNLRSKVKISQNGKALTSLSTSAKVTASGFEMVITLPSSLDTPDNFFSISSGALLNQTIDIESPLFDARGPALDETNGVTFSSTAQTITLKFKTEIKGYPTDAILKNGYISLARNGTSFTEVIPEKNIEINTDRKEIKITLDEWITGSKSKIKIAAGTLKSTSLGTSGNINLTDIVTPAIKVGTTDSSSGSSDSDFTGQLPEIDRTVISSDLKTVTIYFTAKIKNAFSVNNTSSSLATTFLKSHIWLSRSSNNNYELLSGADALTVGSNYIKITFAEPLFKTRNYIKIEGSSLTDSSGNPINEDIITDNITADVPSSSSAPTYEGTELLDNNRIAVYFSVPVIKNTSLTQSELRSSISLSRNGASYKQLTTSDSVTFSGSTMTVKLATPLSGSNNRLKIEASTVTSKTGNPLAKAVTTAYLTAKTTSSSSSEDDEYTDDDTPTASTGSTTYSGDLTTSLSDDFYTLTLKFNEPLLNNLSTLDQLKTKIQISRNGVFSSLSADDYIRINDSESELVIVLSKPADDYFSQVRILSNALRNASGRAVSNAIVTLPLGESDGAARTYVDDKAFISDISMQVNADNIVATFADEDQITSINKSCELLVKIPEEKKSATLNLSKNVVDSVKRYSGTFALSFGASTYYLPTSNIPSLADGDTLSISINKTTSAATSLATAAGRDSFSIEVPASNLKASVVKASGEKKDLAHTAFASKRFMSDAAATGSQFTAVRVENSGAIAPVPSKVEVKAGAIYITSKTLSDGNYAAISAKHSFSNTPNWVETPANTLGSRLILANASGSDLNAGQAISRAETVTIMSKTLGVFCDASGASPFFDMISTDSYYNAVMATVSHNLISGYPDGTFKPNGTLTRAEAMTIVARAMRFMNGKPASASADMTSAEANSILSKFTDAASVDNWAKIDIAECVSAGVVNGDNNGRLNPKANVTRAELIQLMYNVLNKANML